MSEQSNLALSILISIYQGAPVNTNNPKVLKTVVDMKGKVYVGKAGKPVSLVDENDELTFMGREYVEDYYRQSRKMAKCAVQ